MLLRVFLHTLFFLRKKSVWREGTDRLAPRADLNHLARI